MALPRSSSILTTRALNLNGIGLQVGQLEAACVGIAGDAVPKLGDD